MRGHLCKISSAELLRAAAYNNRNTTGAIQSGAVPVKRTVSETSSQDSHTVRGLAGATVSGRFRMTSSSRSPRWPITKSVLMSCRNQITLLDGLRQLIS